MYQAPEIGPVSLCPYSWTSSGRGRVEALSRRWDGARVDGVEGAAVVADAGQRGAGGVGQVLPLDEVVRVGLDQARAVAHEDRGDLVRVRVVQDDHRVAVVEEHAEGVEEARVHEGHAQRDGLLLADRPGDHLLRQQAVEQAARVVDHQLGDARGARGVRDERGLRRVQLDGGAPGDVREVRDPAQAAELGGAGQYGLVRQLLDGHAVQRAGQLRGVGDQPGLVEAGQQLGHDLAGQRGGHHHGDGADAGHGAGQQVDVEVVVLVDGDALGRPDAYRPQPGREVVDHVGQGGVGEVRAEIGEGREGLVEGDRGARELGGGLLPQLAQVEGLLGQRVGELREREHGPAAFLVGGGGGEVHQLPCRMRKR